MKVAVDVTPAVAGGTGVARYVRNLVSALRERDDVDVSLVAFGRGAGTPPEGTHRLAVPLRLLRPLWSTFGQPSVEAVVGRVDVVHATDLVPPASRAPGVMTVHDLAAVELPDLHSPRRVRAQQHQLAAAREAAAVICVSESTAGALVSHGVPRERVVVAPLAATPLPPPATRVIDQPFLLAVGEQIPRKNLDVVVRAFLGCGLPPSWRLVLAGPPGPGAPAGADDARIVVAGRVSDAELARLYADATALCFPSRAEGFGLPLLEAMTAGLPVVASDIAVFREVAGDAALFVDADDEAGWRTAIETVAGDVSIRSRLVVAGHRRAAQFSWGRTAAATVEAYRLAMTCG